jgi:hypothetical protein
MRTLSTYSRDIAAIPTSYLPIPGLMLPPPKALVGRPKRRPYPHISGIRPPSADCEHRLPTHRPPPLPPVLADFPTPTNTPRPLSPLFSPRRATLARPASIALYDPRRSRSRRVPPPSPHLIHALRGSLGEQAGFLVKTSRSGPKSARRDG